MKFNFNLYERTKYWTKSNITIEAETEEEAIYKAKEYLFECNDFEVLYETAVTEETELEDLEGNVIESW